VMVHKWEVYAILPMTEIRNNNFDQSYYDSNYLNHITLHL
jgi:hypothetical protein